MDVHSSDHDILVYMISVAQEAVEKSHSLSQRKKASEASAQAIAELARRGKALYSPLCASCCKPMTLMSQVGYEVDFLCKSCSRRLYATPREASFY